MRLLTDKPHMVALGSPAALGEGKGKAVAPQPAEVDPTDPSALSVVDPTWELLDLQALFLQLNARFFGGRLGAVQVQWSPDMTRSAGQTRFQSLSGGRWRCTILLSEPLLQAALVALRRALPRPEARLWIRET